MSKGVWYHPTKLQRLVLGPFSKSKTVQEKLPGPRGEGNHYERSIKSLLVFASGEGEEVVRAKHTGQTAVVCDQSRHDAKVASNHDNVVFLVTEACIVIVE
jgi:hypothetical protein